MHDFHFLDASSESEVLSGHGSLGDPNLLTAEIFQRHLLTDLINFTSSNKHRVAIHRHEWQAQIRFDE